MKCIMHHASSSNSQFGGRSIINIPGTGMSDDVELDTSPGALNSVRPRRPYLFCNRRVWLTSLKHE